MKALSLLSLGALCASLAVSSCTCEGPGNGPVDGALGSVSAVPASGGFEIRVTGLEASRRVRSLQVDVKIDGASATNATAVGGNDILEAGLDAPKSDFTVVVADTRRLNLPLGAVVRVATDVPPSTITLSKALAIDDTGARRSMTVVVP
jgi:hypothetical protein